MKDAARARCRCLPPSRAGAPPTSPGTVTRRRGANVLYNLLRVPLEHARVPHAAVGAGRHQRQLPALSL